MLGLLAGKTERDRAGLGPDADPRPPARRDRDGRGDARRPHRRALPPRARGLGAAGLRGLVRRPFARPLARTREYVEIVRKALSREPLEHDGQVWKLPLDEAHGGSGLGKPLKLLAKPVQERIPIYLGAIGPKAVEQAGEIADGWLPFLFNPADPEMMLEPVRRGAEAPGARSRTSTSRRSCPSRSTTTSPRRATWRRPWLAFYLGAMGAKDKNFYVELADRYGFGDSARECQEKMLAGDRVGAARGAHRRADRRRLRSPPRPTASTTAWRPTSARASTRSSRCPAATKRRPSCARWPPASPRGALAERRRGPPAGIPGNELSGPVPGRRLRRDAARRAAQARPRAALRRGLEPAREPREGLLRAARRARRGAVLDVAQRLRGARLPPEARWPTAPRSWSLAAATTTRAARPPRRRSPSSSTTCAWPARATCSPSSTGCARRSPPRACSSRRSAAAPAAAALDRRRHRRGRQGARRRARRPAPPRLGRAARVGLRARAGPPRRAARSPARCRTSRPATRSR